MSNDTEKPPFRQITLGQALLALSITASAMAFYFNGQSNVGDRINKTEADLSQRMTLADGALADRISKLETRAAVIEQHQAQSDAGIADTRTALNSFAVEVRGQLGKISDQIAELRPLIVGRPTSQDGVRH